MSGYAKAKLITDYKIEAAEEEQLRQDILSQMDQDAMNRDQYSLWGSIIGGGVGFFLGGPQGAKVGYNVGKQAKYFSNDEFNVSDLEDTKYSGGKFGASEMSDWVDDVKFMDDQANQAMLIDSATNLFSVATMTDSKGVSIFEDGIGEGLGEMYDDSIIENFMDQFNPEDVLP